MALLTDKIIKIIRLKSDNYDCYVSEAAYNEIRLQMSSGDYGSHVHKELTVSVNQLDDIKFSRGSGFVDFAPFDYDDKRAWYFYDGDGDCIVEFEQ